MGHAVTGVIAYIVEVHLSVVVKRVRRAGVTCVACGAVAGKALGPVLPVNPCSGELGGEVSSTVDRVVRRQVGTVCFTECLARLQGDVVRQAWVEAASIVLGV